MLLILYYTIKIWYFQDIRNSTRPTYWQKIWVIVGHRRIIVGHRGSSYVEKINANRKSLLFDNHLGHRGSSWNQLSELYLSMISTVDLGLIVGHRVFYKYPTSTASCSEKSRLIAENRSHLLKLERRRAKNDHFRVDGPSSIEWGRTCHSSKILCK